MIEKYNNDQCVLYIDPPYPLSTRHGKLYAIEMKDAEHIALLDALRNHRAAIVLSGYHCQMYDDALCNWHVVRINTSAENGNTRTEVLWLNDAAHLAAHKQMQFF